MAEDGGAKNIQESVRVAESKTSAEFVVAIQPQSGNYRDIDLIAAATVTAAAMLFAFFGPVVVNSDFVPLNLLVVFGLVWLASSKVPHIRRWLTSEERRKGQVKREAGALFLQYGVSQTRGRTGIMILVSQLENRIEVMADSGILRVVENESWSQLMNEIQGGFNSKDLPATAVVTVEMLGDFLRDQLPVEPDDEDELTNVPVITE